MHTSICCIVTTMTNYTNTQYIYIYICMQNHNDDTMKTSDTVFREIYLSLYWKGCVWEGVGDRTELQHVDPHPHGHQHFFPVLLGCSTGGLEPSLSGCWFSLPHLVSNWSGLQTNWLPVFNELYNSSTPALFSWASQIALIQPIHGQGYTLQFLDRMHLLFT